MTATVVLEVSVLAHYVFLMYVCVRAASGGKAPKREQSVSGNIAHSCVV